MLLPASRARRLGLVLALVCSAPAGALAQAPPPPPPPAQPTLDPVAQEAQQLFVEGREAMKKGDYVTAARVFLRSQELHAAPGTRLNLAIVEEQLGHFARALEQFDLVTRELPDGDDRLPVARDGIARLKPRVPSLRLERAAGAPASMSIKIDGTPVGAPDLGADRNMDPGTYTVTTETPAHEERRYEVKLPEGGHLTLAVEAGRELAPANMRSPAGGSAPRSALTLTGFALGGVGLAGLVTGAVTGGLAIKDKGDAAAQCPHPLQCNGPGLASAGSGHAMAAVSTASFILGIAGVGAGVTLAVLGRDRPVRASVGAVLLGGGGGIGASGAF